MYSGSIRWLFIWCCVALTLAGTAPRAAGSPPAEVLLYLRQGAVDPLLDPFPSKRLSTATTLSIVQFATPPGAMTHAQLHAAGLTPLFYLPQYAFVVRGLPAAAAGLAGVRWAGPYEPAYRLDPVLDPAATHSDPLDLVLHLAPDRHGTSLMRVITDLNGEITRSTGNTLHVVVPANRLPELAANDDVVWIEPLHNVALFNDRSRGIVGAPLVYDTLGLSGAGQLIAITDTGLDVQEALSADFHGRVRLGIPPATLNNTCSPTQWSDSHGHGTHVAGIAAGNGALSGGVYAGIAPAADLLIQNASNGGANLACLPIGSGFLSLPYAAGARIHNASFGAQTAGDYVQWDADVDRFLWEHPDLLVVAAAGNYGTDAVAPFGSVDPGSIASPAGAKNVLAVGASESDRWNGGPCSALIIEQLCWKHFSSSSTLFTTAPIADDPISDNPAGLAAFSSRGPSSDGRIKPEIVAPGTSIISSRTHAAGASAGTALNAHYGYRSGTSMAAPLVSGMAALVRQWLARDRMVGQPSAALIKALLLNGSVDLAPGQYGVALPEIPLAWPNNAAGWGRASLPTSVDLSPAADQIWFLDGQALDTGASYETELQITAGAPLRVTLVWTDYPGSAAASRSLVNDLDLEVELPGGSTLHGNQTADLSRHPACRSAGADRCNNHEAIMLAEPVAGRYTLRVKGVAVPFGPQPFALVVHAAAITDPALAPPILAPLDVDGPRVTLNWGVVAGADRYVVQLSPDEAFGPTTVARQATTNSFNSLRDLGETYARVRACHAGRCGAFSTIGNVSVEVAPTRIFLTSTGR
ncbi:MAG TPA: S8 family serine peptidase [Roseiflexaceae bacterium]|nr:S8 family serine peptidase [Roseiflexaceae bacterium]